MNGNFKKDFITKIKGDNYMPQSSEPNHEIIERMRTSGILSPNANLERMIRVSEEHAVHPGEVGDWELATKKFVLRGTGGDIPNIEELRNNPGNMHGNSSSRM